jgi:hypothetical protein
MIESKRQKVKNGISFVKSSVLEKRYVRNAMTKTIVPIMMVLKASEVLTLNQFERINMTRAKNK